MTRHSTTPFLPYRTPVLHCRTPLLPYYSSPTTPPEPLLPNHPYATTAAILCRGEHTASPLHHLDLDRPVPPPALPCPTSSTVSGPIRRSSRKKSKKSAEDITDKYQPIMDQMKQGQLLKEVLPSSGLKYNSGHWRRFRTTAEVLIVAPHTPRNCFYLEPGLISPSMQQQWPNDLISNQHSRRLDLPISLFSNCVCVSFYQ